MVRENGGVVPLFGMTIMEKIAVAIVNAMSNNA